MEFMSHVYWIKFELIVTESLRSVTFWAWQRDTWQSSGTPYVFIIAVFLPYYQSITISTWQFKIGSCYVCVTLPGCDRVDPSSWPDNDGPRHATKLRDIRQPETFTAFSENLSKLVKPITAKIHWQHYLSLGGTECNIGGQILQYLGLAPRMRGEGGRSAFSASTTWFLFEHDTL